VRAMLSAVRRTLYKSAFRGDIRNAGAAQSTLPSASTERVLSEQRRLSSVAYDTKRKVTRPEPFLQETDEAVVA